MYNLKKIFFILVWVICYSGIAIASEEQTETKISTNPAKTMVEEWGLPNYDTALDSVDYSVSYKKIKWPWQTDPQRQEKRIEALRKLAQAKAPYYVDEIVQRNPRLPLSGFSWDWGYEDDGQGPLYTDGDNATDELLFEVLPYIPEVGSCGLEFTKVTDEGLKALFYLPMFQGLSLTTTEPETHPLPITDKGIEIISRHPSLENIGLRNVRITDQSFKSLAQNAKKLRQIYYEGDSITSRGLEYLKEANSLVTLQIENTNTETMPSTAELLCILAEIPNLQSLDLRGYDFSMPPDEKQLATLRKFNGKLDRLYLWSKIHPKTLKAICDMENLHYLSVFSRGTGREFSKENMISYEKAMYRFRKMNRVPDYYEELEKPYFEEFYVRTWTSSDGKTTHKAAFVDLVNDKVFLKTSYDNEPFSIPILHLSKEDRAYARAIVGQ